jgi:hypothetical protein
MNHLHCADVLEFDGRTASAHHRVLRVVKELAAQDLPRGWGWLRTRLLQQLTSLAALIAKAAASTRDSIRVPIMTRAVECLHASASDTEVLLVSGAISMTRYARWLSLLERVKRTLSAPASPGRVSRPDAAARDREHGFSTEVAQTADDEAAPRPQLEQPGTAAAAEEHRTLGRTARLANRRVSVARGEPPATSNAGPTGTPIEPAGRNVPA